MNVNVIFRSLALTPARKNRNQYRQLAVTFDNSADLDCLNRLLNHQVIGTFAGDPPPAGFSRTEIIALSVFVPDQPANLVSTIDPLSDLARYIRLQLQQQRNTECRLHPDIEPRQLIDALGRLLLTMGEPSKIVFKLGN
ncbi:hypothetical protein ACFQ4C_17945 [Larkinella insperata]|uniref:Uncharacterized protein n=1 Tax=Larkinella insperata TaxID=332158 RepID=A0ABW3QA28_9BACT|nr:hypothetical protein [Larkinella insperata]